MVNLDDEQKAYALALAADALTYAWESTEEAERADAEELGVGHNFDWYREGYLAARDELVALSQLMTAHAAGELVTREVNGL